MIIDNTTVAMAFFLMAISFMGAMIAFMYYADKKPRKR